MDSVSILGASLPLEWADVTLRTAVLVFAGIEVFCGLIWLLLVVWCQKSADIALPYLQVGYATTFSGSL